MANLAGLLLLVLALIDFSGDATETRKESRKSKRLSSFAANPHHIPSPARLSTPTVESATSTDFPSSPDSDSSSSDHVPVQSLDLGSSASPKITGKSISGELVLYPDVASRDPNGSCLYCVLVYRDERKLGFLRARSGGGFEVEGEYKSATGFQYRMYRKTRKRDGKDIYALRCENTKKYMSRAHIVTKVSQATSFKGHECIDILDSGVWMLYKNGYKV